MEDATHDELEKSDPRRAFVEGAKSWEYHQENATMWQSDQNICIAEAEKSYQSVVEELERLASTPDFIRVHMRNWTQEERERFCLHQLGDDWQELRANSEKMAGLVVIFLHNYKTLEVGPNITDEVLRLARLLAPPTVTSIDTGATHSAPGQSEPHAPGVHVIDFDDMAQAHIRRGVDDGKIEPKE